MTSDSTATVRDPFQAAAPPSERFSPLRVLAHGGSATVLLAHDAELDRTVALKVLLDRLLAEPRAVRRFEAEIDVLERLEHPAVAPVLARGRTAADAPWFAMPYYDAGSLRDLLTEMGPVPAPRLAGFALEILDALAYVHSQGIVHRDIKLANILLDRSNVAVLCDFGIAADSEDRKTNAGAHLGTPVYAAPEQLSDPRLAEARSDLYSLGITIFAAATAETPSRLIYPHTRDDALSLLSEPLRSVVACATEPHVNRRYASAEEMADALAALL